MKILYPTFFIVLLLSAGLKSKAAGCPAPGTYSIGPTGDYPSLTQVVTDLGSCTLTGAYIFEFQPAYSSTVETFPISIPLFSGSSSTNTITIRPQTAASNINITSANSTGTLMLNGTAYILFDGRPGGIGSPKNLTIENTNAGISYAVKFVNDAINNNFSYCKLRSANNGSTSGTVVFGNAGTGNGNDNNIIDNCDIFDAPTGTPLNAVYQSGSVSPNDNSNDVFSNNNIYNFFNASADMNGILLADNASGWIISGNSFYQTATRNLTGSNNIFSAIQMASSSVSNISITGNYIGGTAALAGGSALTLTGSGVLNALLLTTGSSIATSVQSNTIKNISLTTSSNVSPEALIKLSDGKFDIGSLATPNVLGSQSVSNSVTVSFSNSSASPNNPSFAGIYSKSATADPINISGNTIGGINITGTSTTANVVGIYFTGSSGIYTLDNNTIGSQSTSNNFINNLNTYLIGIWGNSSNSAFTQTISNNVIVNLTSANTLTGNPLYGILTQGTAVYNTISNTVYNLTSASTSTSQSVMGIYLYAISTTGQKVTNNKIYNLNNTATSAATGLSGIYYNGPTSGTNIVSGNFIHSLNLNTSNANGFIIGIHSVTGTTTYQNNMVRLGIKNDGTSLTKGCKIFGIAENGGTNNFYFNSVYVGGSCSVSASKTYAFYSSVSLVTRNYINNIFFNARSSSTTAGGARHYGIYLSTNSGLISNYNDIIATGTDKMFGYFGTDISTLSSWRTATFKDANTISSDPKFISPATSGATVDLHINPAAYTLVEGGGTVVAAVTDDYDGQLRASYTPTDIGADAITNAAATRVDVGATALATPAVSGCYSGAETVRITIKNYSASTINFATTPVTVIVNVTGAVSQSLTGVINSSTLASGASVNVTMSSTLDMTVAGTYTFNATILSISGAGVDADITNDTMTVAATRTVVIGPATWLGVNTNWNDASNWCGGIPDVTKDITIPDLGVGGNYPVITTGTNGAVKNITIATNASVTVNTSGSLTISGIVTNNGGITDDGDIILNGTANTNFPGNGSINIINNLTVSKTSGGTVTFNKAFSIAGVFTPTLGNIILNNTVTLTSTSSSTARVGQSGANFTYGDSGNFEVQRYYPAKRAWRLATSPLAATGNIYDNWQNNGLYGPGEYNKGMLVTGPGASPGTNGLDNSAQNNASLKAWDTTSQILTDVVNTLATNLSDNSNPSGAENSGYFIFVRGDRNPSNTTPPNVNITTLSSKGFLQTGTQVFRAASPSGDPSIHRKTLIGNPYASPIDFGQLTKTNLIDQFYVWDPIPLSMGRYVTITRAGGTYIMTPDRGAGGPNQYIQSGQAFFVETDLDMNTPPTLTIQESHKVSNNILTIFRPGGPGSNQPEGLRINLNRRQPDGSLLLADGIYTLYDNSYSAKVSLEDAAKLNNIDETFSLVRDGNSLAIEKRPLTETGDTLYLKLTRTTKRDYSFEFRPDKIDHNNLAGFLEDRFLGTSTPLNMNSTTQIDFSVTSDILSSAEDRFKVVFRPSVIYTVVKAAIEDNDIAVQWELPSETNISKYVIERSTDGNSFTAISEKLSAGDTKNKVVYKWLDENPTTGEYYYRIKSISKNGVIGYSDIAKVIMVKAGVGMYVFPNPVTGNNIALQMNKMPAGIYSTTLVNNMGQEISHSIIKHTGGTGTQNIIVNPSVTTGVYQLKINGPDKKENLLSIIIKK